MGRLAAILFLLVVALGITGCMWTSHVRCHGGREGVCSVDAYGLFTTVGHVEVPARDIVMVVADERTARRGGTSVRVSLLTRSSRVDLTGEQRLGGTVSASTAAEVVAALRPFEPGKSASPPDVDMWLWPPPLLMLLVVLFGGGAWTIAFRLVVQAITGRDD